MIVAINKYIGILDFLTEINSININLIRVNLVSVIRAWV